MGTFKQGCASDHPDSRPGHNERLSDSRIVSTPFTKRWLPFAEYCDMLPDADSESLGDDGKKDNFHIFILTKWCT